MLGVNESDTVSVLYEQHEQRIRAFCRRRLANPADLDDAVQETFLRAQRGLHRFEPDAPVWPWLVTIAAHVCTDIHRLYQHESPPLLHDAPMLEADEHVASRTRIAIVDEALRSLPPRYRTSLYLRHFEGSSYEEIARSQGMSVASVRSVLLRGRRQLGLRIKALAQAERQWPLPSTVTMAAQRARERVRGWMRDAGRIVQSAVAVIESVASVGAYLAGGPATMIAVGALSVLTGGADVTQPALPTDAIREGVGTPTTLPFPSGPILEVGNEQTGLVIGSHGLSTYTAGPPFFTVGTPNPPFAPEGTIQPEVGAYNDDEDGFGVYVNGQGHTLVGFRTDCTLLPPVQRIACDVARAALNAAGNPAPDESNPGVGTGS